ncbi:MAG: ABC transporter substrate-binding protein [Clostridiaceae bacterium]|nr:ABC transporter substrate-binding protein [Clostridiaceae bacterium]
MKKLTTLLLIALLAFSTFAACGSINTKPTDDTKSEDDVPAHEDSIVIAIESEPTTLNPYDHAAVVSGYMNQLTYNRLFKIDVDTLKPVPDLVESFENTDENTWVFTIKQGVMFHDGTEMTAEDVKASMEYARDFTSSNKYTGFWTNIEVTDKYTVKITTNGPYALILNDLSANGNTIVPKALIDSGNDFNKNPIGSGPYKFVQWTLGDNLTFVKNENYFDKEHTPTITDMTWRVIPEGSSRTIALENGEVDLIIDVASTDVSRILDTEGLKLDEVDGTRMNFMALNNEKDIFSNVLVRKAINSLIDKAAVVEVAANGQGKPAIGMNPSAYAGTTDDGADEYNVQKAMEYFKQAGVDPTTLSFTCMCYTDATRRSAEVIQGCLAEAGITMNIETLDFAAFLSKLLEGNYEAAIAGYSSSDLLTYMKGLWHSSSINATNSSRMSDSEIDSLITLASSQLDDTERTATMTSVAKLTNENTPFIPLFTSSVIRAYNESLNGVKVGASGLMYFCDLSW